MSWQTNTLLKIGQHEDAAKVAIACQFPNDGISITEIQIEKLRLVISDSIWHFANPDYDFYVRRHTTVPSKIILGRRASLYADFVEEMGHKLPNDSSLRLKASWDFLQTTSLTNKFTTKLTHVALSSIRAGVVNSINPMDIAPTQIFNQGAQMGASAIDDAFEALESPLDIITRERSVLVAYVALQAKYHKHDKVSPLCFTFYWSKNYEHWVPLNASWAEVYFKSFY